MNQPRPDKLIPVLIGGAFIGVTSAIPGINFLNCACCLLVLGGGALASYLYLRDYPDTLPPATYADGALLGLLAGLVGVVVDKLLSFPIHWIGAQAISSGLRETLEGILSQNQGLPPEAAVLLRRLAAGGAGAGFFLISLLMGAVVFTIFGAVGGILGLAIFQKRQPAGPAGAPAGEGVYTPPPPTPPTPGPAQTPPASEPPSGEDVENGESGNQKK